jgi:Mor family transcriptional regulator
MTMNHLDHLSHLLVGEKPLRFNQHQNRLYIDMDWSNDVSENDYIVIECFRKVDPDTYTDIWDDIFLKKYCTQLIKRQWGANLSKFQGIQMLGGVQMNGEQIYLQAQEEINKLEEQIQLAYELPPMHQIG